MTATRLLGLDCYCFAEHYPRHAEEDQELACKEPYVLQRGPGRHQLRHLSVNEMIQAIERLHCIREIWRCRAGWGIMFVREHNEPPKPAQETDETWREYSDKYRQYMDTLMELTKENTVVYNYYDTLEECIRAEFEARVVRKEGLP